MGAASGTAVGLAAALAFALAGCGCGGPATPDAGRDAGARDAGPRDAGHDAGRDAGPPDAGRDAAGDSGILPGPYEEAGWVPLPGYPEGCVFERAEHPERVFQPEWVDCPGFPGCRLLTVPEGRKRNLMEEVGSHDGARAYFAFLEYPSGTTIGHRWVAVIAASEGDPPGAWRMPPTDVGPLCSVSRMTPQGDQAAFMTHVYGGGLPERERIYAAPLAGIGRVTEPVAELGGPAAPPGIQHLAVSATTVAGDIQPSALVMIAEPDRLRVIEPAADLSGIPQNVQVVGRHVLWEDWGARVRVADASMTSGPAVFLDAPGGDVKSFRTDGVTMVWQQAYDRAPDGAYARVELWASPYAATRAELRPHLVRTLDYRVRGQVAGGYFYYWTRTDVPEGFAQVLHFIDLRDGRSRSIVLPHGYTAYAGLLAVSDDEVFVGGPTAVFTGDTVLRMPWSLIPYEDAAPSP